MSKDYERLTETSEAFIYAAMSRLMTRRLARSCGLSDGLSRQLDEWQEEGGLRAVPWPS
jgi:hypothetical protein